MSSAAAVDKWGFAVPYSITLARGTYRGEQCFMVECFGDVLAFAAERKSAFKAIEAAGFEFVGTDAGDILLTEEVDGDFDAAAARLRAAGCEAIEFAEVAR